MTFNSECGVQNGCDTFGRLTVEMEKRFYKQQLCWNVNSMGVSCDGMEREDEGQGLEWWVV
jgi:hypothetical protein